MPARQHFRKDGTPPGHLSPPPAEHLLLCARVCVYWGEGEAREDSAGRVQLSSNESPWIPGAANNVHTGGITFCGAVGGRGCCGDEAQVLEAASQAERSEAKLVSHELRVVSSGRTNDNLGPQTANGRRREATPTDNATLWASEPYLPSYLCPATLKQECVEE